MTTDLSHTTPARWLILGSNSYLAQVMVTELQADSNAQVFLANRHTRPDVFDENSRVAALEQLIRDVEPTSICNFVGVFSQTLDHCMSWNYDFPRDLLLAALASETGSKVVLLGSAAEYGLSREPKRFIEGDNLSPLTSYGYSKAKQSTLFAQKDFENLKIVYARTFNVWGGGMATRTLPGRLEQEFFAQAAASAKVLVEDSNSVRDFVPSKEFGRALKEVVENCDQRVLFNLATGIGTSVETFAREFASLFGKQAIERLQFKPTQTPTFSIADTTLLDTLRRR